MACYGDGRASALHTQPAPTVPHSTPPPPIQVPRWSHIWIPLLNTPPVAKPAPKASCTEPLTCGQSAQPGADSSWGVRAGLGSRVREGLSLPCEAPSAKRRLTQPLPHSLSLPTFTTGFPKFLVYFPSPHQGHFFILIPGLVALDPLVCRTFLICMRRYASLSRPGSGEEQMSYFRERASRSIGHTGSLQPQNVRCRYQRGRRRQSLPRRHLGLAERLRHSQRLENRV